MGEYNALAKDSHFLIGMTDLDEENIWVWADGVSIDPLVRWVNVVEKIVN